MTIASIEINRFDYICGVCKDLPEIPILTYCQHLFCKVCIDQVKDLMCPICRRVYTPQELIVSRVHRDTIDKIRQVQQHELSVNPLERAPSPLDIAPPPQKDPVMTFNEEAKSFFLSNDLVDDRNELRTLERLYASKKIESKGDKRVFMYFVAVSCKLITNTPSKLSLDQQQFLLETLLDFHDMKGIGHFDEEYFEEEYFEKLEAALRDGSKKLSVESWIRAYNILKEYLNEENPLLIEENSLLESLLECLISSISHPSISSNLQMDAVTILSIHAKNIIDKRKFDLYVRCLESIRNGSEIFRERVFVNLLECISSEETCEELKNEILTIASVHIYKDYSNESGAKILQIIFQRIIDANELKSVRLSAAEILNNFIYSVEYDQSFNIKPHIVECVDALIHLILQPENSAHAPYFARALFSSYFRLQPSNPFYSTILNTHSRIIHDDTLPISVREDLFYEIYKWKLDHFQIERAEPHIINLTSFMLKKISDPDHPIELKSTYVRRLVCWLVTKHIHKYLEFVFPVISTVEKLSELEPIKNNAAFVSDFCEARRPRRIA